MTEYLAHDQLLLLTAVGTVTGLRAGQPRYRGSIRGRDRRFLTSQTGSVTNQPPVQWVNGNGKGHPKQATKDQRGKRYISTFSFTSALYWVGGQRHAPAALPPGRTQCPLYGRLGGPPGPVWTGAENLALTGIRFSDRSARCSSYTDCAIPVP